MSNDIRESCKEILRGMCFTPTDSICDAIINRLQIFLQLTIEECEQTFCIRYERRYHSRNLYNSGSWKTEPEYIKLKVAQEYYIDIDKDELAEPLAEKMLDLLIIQTQALKIMEEEKTYSYGDYS